MNFSLFFLFLLLLHLLFDLLHLLASKYLVDLVYHCQASFVTYGTSKYHAADLMDKDEFRVKTRSNENALMMTLYRHQTRNIFDFGILPSVFAHHCTVLTSEYFSKKSAKQSILGPIGSETMVRNCGQKLWSEIVVRNCGQKLCI